MSTYRNVIYKGAIQKLMIAALVMLTITSLTSFAQDSRKERRSRRNAGNVELQLDSLAVPEVSDSLRAHNDSIARVDSIAAADSMMMLKKSSLGAPAFTAARDSIIEDFSDGKRLIYYYGDVSVTYGNMKLTADYMEYDLANSTLYARGTTDSLGGRTGDPVMQQGESTYTMEEVRYNFETRKARITNMVIYIITFDIYACRRVHDINSNMSV